MIPKSEAEDLIMFEDFSNSNNHLYVDILKVVVNALLKLYCKLICVIKTKSKTIHFLKINSCNLLTSQTKGVFHEMNCFACDIKVLCLMT